MHDNVLTLYLQLDAGFFQLLICTVNQKILLKIFWHKRNDSKPSKKPTRYWYNLSSTSITSVLSFEKVNYCVKKLVYN